MEVYDEVELRQEFRPSCLVSCEQFCRGEVFQVLVVGDNVYQFGQAFQVTSPLFEHFEDHG